MKITTLLFFLFGIMLQFSCNAQGTHNDCSVIVGASCFEEYLPLIKTKNVAVIANPTSMVGSSHLVDTLVKLNVKVIAVFAPEHGFRGEAGAGETIENGFDKKSGVKVISLYGNHKKPTQEDLKNVDVVIYDIQDVGTRFYTYISTLQYVMEACAVGKIPMIILDRPNPHGYYIDGPVLDIKYNSFVGMQPVPVVHGLTIAEYAMMLNGEKWLKDAVQCEIRVVKMKKWDHHCFYDLPVKPSPNLPNALSVKLYPSLCFFEGTIVSVGRGTEKPFQVIGYPENPVGNYFFTPKSIEGKAKNPPYENKLCKGFDLTTIKLVDSGKIDLSYLIAAYNSCPDKKVFFTDFFEKLAGTSLLRQQIQAGLSESEIRKSWQNDLTEFQKIRKKYLIYPE